MANFALKRGPSTRLQGLAVEDGSFIITTDNHDLYADIGTARYSLGSILEVASLPSENINTSKFYYLTTDKCLYKYVGGAWANISQSGFEIKTGTENGTISVNGVNVAVFGLKSAAFMEASAFDAAGAAAAVQGDTTKTVKDVEGEAAAAQAAADKAAEDLGKLDASLKAVAKSGKAADVTIDDAEGKYAATNVEDALLELASQIGTTGEAGKVTITESAPTDYAKSYEFKQNNVTIGTINIPKDMVVQTGTVVTLTEADAAGHAKGTYLKLVLANAENSELWIPVDSLIEYVTGDATTEITVSVDPATHVVTAVINDGSIAKAKLTTEVQASLNKADSAVQAVTVLGKELKDGGEVTADEAKTALGLKSAAYQEASAFDAAGAAAGVKTEVIGAEGDAAAANTIYGAKAHATELNTAMDTRVKELESAIGENGSVATQIATEIQKLDKDDTAVAGEYVSAVSEADGIITVTRTALPDYTETYEAKGSAKAVQGETDKTVAQVAQEVVDAQSTLIGQTGDAATANTIYGVKAYADAAAASAVSNATTWVDF